MTTPTTPKKVKHIRISASESFELFYPSPSPTTVTSREPYQVKKGERIAVRIEQTEEGKFFTAYVVLSEGNRQYVYSLTRNEKGRIVMGTRYHGRLLAELIKADLFSFFGTFGKAPRRKK